MHLYYKSRGESIPVMKPKVFFCSHPADRDKLEHIASTLIECADCGVWYIDSDSIREQDIAELLDDVSEMNLLVVPMSYTFFAEDSFARRIVIPYMLQKHIPFLPLLQSSDLVPQFSKLYGSIQYLKEYDDSSTALPFEEKLNKFLQCTLISRNVDSMQDAFRARIFFSYRKKDRKYAREVIRKIHQCKGLEDIAIWYDEYLIPGESYTESIKNAIEKADIFLLAVTPNLVKEKNYVETHEYPFAKSLGKTVVPCVLCDTNLSDLRKRFKGLPNIVETDKLQTFLSSLLYNKTSDMEPLAQKYHLGCAYLLGIDVELNHAYGIQLIEQAAEQGFKDAVSFIYSAYLYGIGVEQNNEKSIQWLKKYINICVSSMNTSEGNTDIAKEIIAKQMDLASIQIGSIKNDECIITVEQTLAYLNRYKTYLDTYLYGYLYANALLKKASIFYSGGDADNCIGTCLDGIRISQKILPIKNNYEIYQLLNRFYCKAGDMLMYKWHTSLPFFRSKYLREAYNYYKNNYDISAKSMTLYEKGQLTIDRSEIMFGRVSGDFKITEMVDADYITYLCRKDHAIAATKIADVLLEEGNIADAIKYYSIAEKELDRIVSIGLDTIPIKREIGLIHRKKSDVLAEQGEIAEALNEINHACRIGNEIFKATHSEQYQHDICVYYFQTAELCSVIGQQKTAREYYEKAYSGLNGLSNTTQIKQLRKHILARLNVGH